MDQKLLTKITALSIDVGAEAPTLTYVRVAPSLDGYAFIDVDVGIKFQGRGVRTLLDAEVEGAAEITGSVTRFGLEGALRLKLGPLRTSFPCAGLCRLGFARKPKLALESSFGVKNPLIQLPFGFSLSAVDRFVATHGGHRRAAARLAEVRRDSDPAGVHRAFWCSTVPPTTLYAR